LILASVFLGLGVWMVRNPSVVEEAYHLGEDSPFRVRAVGFAFIGVSALLLLIGLAGMVLRW
jgi:hypothetical protein